jgi:heme exporter protein C
MSAVYRYPLYLTMVGFFLLFLALLLIRTRTEIRRRRLAALLARENRR